MQFATPDVIVDCGRRRHFVGQTVRIRDVADVAAAKGVGDALRFALIAQVQAELVDVIAFARLLGIAVVQIAFGHKALVGHADQDRRLFGFTQRLGQRIGAHVRVETAERHGPPAGLQVHRELLGVPEGGEGFI